MGDGSYGSRVSLLVGHMGYGSQNVTHCQLWAKYSEFGLIEGYISETVKDMIQSYY